MAKFVEHEIVWNRERIKRIWDYYSTNPGYSSQYFGYQAGKYVVSEITNHIKEFETVLDFSCGPGDLMAHLLQKLKPNQKVYGVDVSPNSVNIVNQRFKNNQNFVEAITLDRISSSHYGLFDLIISTEVVEHLDNSELFQMLSTSFQLLKKGGYLVLTTPNNEDLDRGKTLCPECGCIFHRWQHQRNFTPDSLKEIVEKHSFNTKVVKTIAWASKIRKILSIVKPLPKWGIMYLGQKV